MNIEHFISALTATIPILSFLTGLYFKHRRVLRREKIEKEKRIEKKEKLNNQIVKTVNNLDDRIDKFEKSQGKIYKRQNEIYQRQDKLNLAFDIYVQNNGTDKNTKKTVKKILKEGGK